MPEHEFADVILLLETIDFLLRCGIIVSLGALAQLGAHHTGSVGVRGSSPLCSTRIKAYV